MCKYIDVFILKYYMIIYTQFEFQLFSPVILCEYVYIETHVYVNMEILKYHFFGCCRSIKDFISISFFLFISANSC